MGRVGRLAADERAEFATLLAGLSSGEWEAPVLPGWSVRDVAAHVISYEPLGWTGALSRLARARLSLHRANAILVRESQALGPEEILDRFRRYPRPAGLTSAFGGRIALTDGLIHQQDVQRALGRERLVPEERLRVAIRFALWAPALPGWRLARGLHLNATDIGAEWGRGESLHGSAEALLMAVAGRDVLNECWVQV